jgi:hypothetical protein
MSEPLPWYGHPAEPTLVTIGDVGVGQTTVVTPSGSAPVGQTTFQFTDLSVTRENIPTWAIVCAVVFFVFCFLGLLFLLVKERRTDGFVQVVVQGPHLLHTVQLPVWATEQVWDYNQRVNYARSLAAAAR